MSDDDTSTEPDAWAAYRRRWLDEDRVPPGCTWCSDFEVTLKHDKSCPAAKRGGRL